MTREQAGGGGEDAVSARAKAAAADDATPPSSSSTSTFPGKRDGGEDGSPLPWQAEVDAAKEEAKRRLAKMLSRPEDLARLPELREQVAAKLYKAEQELAASLEASVEGVRTGVEALHTARAAVEQTQANIARIEALCKEQENDELSSRRELLRDLSVMRVNLKRTIDDAKAIIALPEQAAKAIEMLNDENNLFACWEELTTLATSAQPARVALEAARRQPHGGVSRAASRPAATHFAAIDEAIEKFEAILWRTVHSSLFAGRGGSKALVRACRVVEGQEQLDAELAAQAKEDAEKNRNVGDGDEEKNDKPAPAAAPGKEYKKRMLREVRDAVEERFTMTVESLMGDVDVGGGPLDVPMVLENMNVLMQQLTDAFDYAVPAFPPKYRIFESVMAPAWHRHVSKLIDKLVAVARDLSNADIIVVLNWYQSYAEAMEALGVDVEVAPSEPPGTPKGVSTPPPSVPAVPPTVMKTGGPLPPGKTGRGKNAFDSPGGADGSGEPSVLSLESFLATGAGNAAAAIETVDEKEVEGTKMIDVVHRNAEGIVRNDGPESPGVSEDDDETMTYPARLVDLVDVYTSRMAQTVHTWSVNLHRMTASQPLKAADDGSLWTASDVEFFRLLNEQLEVAVGGGPQLVPAAAVAIASILADFAAQQHKRLGGAAATSSSTVTSLSSPVHFRRPSSTAATMGLTTQERAALAAAKTVEYNVLLAGVNDASRCHRLASEMESSLVKALGSTDAMVTLANKGSASGGETSIIRPALDAFMSNAEHCASAASAAVVTDPSVVALFAQLFVVDKTGGGAWIEGEVTETLVATIVDYLGDVEQYVTRNLAPMVCEAVLTRVVKIIIDACMRHLQVIRPGTVDRMAADEDVLRECFGDYLPYKIVDPWLQRLADIRDVAAADDAESFVLAYGILVQSMPELGLEPAERMLAARKDIPRATQRAILEECRELHNSQIATMTSVTAASTAKKGLRF